MCVCKLTSLLEQRVPAFPFLDYGLYSLKKSSYVSLLLTIKQALSCPEECYRLYYGI